MSKTIYDLKLHEGLILNDTEMIMKVVTRVPGGWVYTTTLMLELGARATEVFVPYSDEFNPNKESSAHDRGFYYEDVD